MGGDGGGGKEATSSIPVRSLDGSSEAGEENGEDGGGRAGLSVLFRHNTSHDYHHWYYTKHNDNFTRDLSFLGWGNVI